MLCEVLLADGALEPILQLLHAANLFTRAAAVQALSVTS
jgi:hypothetical protein